MRGRTHHGNVYVGLNGNLGVEFLPVRPVDTIIVQTRENGVDCTMLYHRQQDRPTFG